MRTALMTMCILSLALAACSGGGATGGGSASDGAAGGSASAQKYPGAPATGKEETTPSGLKYIRMQEGKGDTPKAGANVSVHYTGYLMNGTKFDSSVDRGQPIQFPLGQGAVIKGWDEGIAMMKVGEKGKLIIPAELGYGAAGSGSLIPPNSVLVFDVELVDAK
jgi:peptidylprolyl isomerase